MEEQKMVSIEEKMKAGSLVNGVVNGNQTNLLEEMKLLREIQDHSGTRKTISSELWYACAGPLVSLPQVGSLVYYFPQGHSEQVAVSTRRTATSQIPNYPNLPSQLLCQVHNVTLHADKDTDEIYAQMSLQPVNSEKDVLPIPDFWLKPSKHPSEFFCKTLTASDTSTHGGFSVPRRAAEKLYPPLDYTMQPPTQELIVKDLHGNSWTFRHIYRGQPKRHLLTTGWSIFVGSKRLKAGDSVLFIRDEKSQLMVGVRRANRQQTALPSSVLSADSMHIGVLAAAAHAAANRSPFTVFYNPRACPSEFVVPLAKFRKAAYGTQVSVGMRFGMMFETEESSKRRYMGTIIGVSDLDPLRWPGSKWRNLQVEWDEPGCSDKQNRVSLWEIETPESLFIFPSLTSGLKRPMLSGFSGGETDWGNMVKRPVIWHPENFNASFTYSSIANPNSDPLLKMFVNPQVANYPGICESALNKFSAKGGSFDDAKSISGSINPMPQLNQSVATDSYVSNQTDSIISPSPKMEIPQNSKPEPEHSVNELNQVTPKPSPLRSDNSENKAEFHGLTSLWPENPLLEPSGFASHQLHLQQADSNNPNVPMPPLESEDFMSNSPFFSLPGMYGSPGSLPMFGLQESSMNLPMPVMNQDLWDQQLNNEISNAMLDKIQNPSECLIGNFGSDVQSQITSVSLADSQAFSQQEFPDSSGGTSSSNADFEKGPYMNNNSWQPVAPRVRTYTKVQKAGSVGRSIDVSSFKNYGELCTAIECMFGLDGLLNNPRESGWKLVYVDYENDVLLIGDDPWEEFVGCVRCIRILSPSEVQQMSEEGLKLLNDANVQGLTASVTGGYRA